MIIFLDLPKIREGRKTALLPYTLMHFVLPTSGLDVPCAVPKFTGIPAVTANPHTQYSLYCFCSGTVCGDPPFYRLVDVPHVVTSTQHQFTYNCPADVVDGNITTFEQPVNCNEATNFTWPFKKPCSAGKFYRSYSCTHEQDYT